jgi:hypothetical protein
LKFATVAGQNAKKMSRQKRWDNAGDSMNVQIDSARIEPGKK